MTRSYARGIIVGVDGSPHSRQAVDWAVNEATRRHCPLRLVHAEVWDLMPDKQLAAAKELLRREAAYTALVAPGLSVTTELHDATPAGALVAEGAGAEMIVVGNRGRGGFASLALGSVSVELASHAPCPLVVVRHSDQQLDTGPSTGRVVVGLDGSAMSEQALDFAFQEASLRGVGLTAVYARALPIVSTGLMGQLQADVYENIEGEKLLLAESVAGWADKYPDVDVVQKIPVGHVAYELMDEARGAVLVVVGSRGRGGFKGLFLGSTSQALVHHAPCPVAIVRRS